MNYEETLKFDVGLKPHPRFPRQQKMGVHKPLLSDLIDSVELHSRSTKRPLPIYNIETKSLKSTDNIYHPVPEKFKTHIGCDPFKGIVDRVLIIQSFDPRTLRLHRQYPMVKTSLLIEGFDKRGLEKQIEELGFSPAIYSPEFNLVNQPLLNDCHRRNIRVIPWTVDDRETMDRLIKLGVDGIITDYPDLFN